MSISYRVEISEIEKIEFGENLIERYNKLTDIKGRIDNQIEKYNRLVKIRKDVAQASEEYLEHSYLGRLYERGEFRILLIRGCESQLDILLNSINNLQSEMDSMMWVSPERASKGKTTVTVVK